MARPHLHLDADTSIKALHNALRERGHDVTRTPDEWMPVDADDQTQLLGASAQGRILFSFNIRDFQVLAKQYTNHHGIILASQSRWSIVHLIQFLDRALAETEETDWIGILRWLKDFR